MNVTEIRAALGAALEALAAIDREAEIARETYAKFRRNCSPWGIAQWSLDSPPGHLPLADVERLRLLAAHLEAAQRCQVAAAEVRRELLRLAKEQGAA